ncbi:MAG: agmatine deiminase [Xanthomonadales bacterium]|nr:agmatine deiminase [Xanthomonadales bacterium]
MSLLLPSTPRADGFHMPAEWSPQSQVWMLWPERPDNWRYGAKPAQAAFAEVAAAIARFTPVTVGVSAGQFENACARLDPAVRVLELSANDAWARDVGPSFVINRDGEVRGVDWQFNAWGGLHGGLYQPWNRDDQVAEKICRIEGLDRYRSDGFVLEGGAIHVDGEGTVLTTEECLLNRNRNPELQRGQIEQHLRDYLNVEKVLWLPQGIVDDETNGHIDNMACFVAPGVIALAWTEDRNDPQHAICQRAWDYLRSQRDAKGRALQVHRIVLPQPLSHSEEEARGIDVARSAWPRRAGARMAASYVNFLISNGAVILPSFDDPTDQVAANQLADLMPGFQIVCIPCREILLGGGNIHCITQQQPTAVKEGTIDGTLD